MVLKFEIPNTRGGFLDCGSDEPRNLRVIRRGEARGALLLLQDQDCRVHARCVGALFYERN